MFDICSCVYFVVQVIDNFIACCKVAYPLPLIFQDTVLISQNLRYVFCVWLRLESMKSKQRKKKIHFSSTNCYSFVQKHGRIMKLQREKMFNIKFKVYKSKIMQKFMNKRKICDQCVTNYYTPPHTRCWLCRDDNMTQYQVKFE